MALRDSGVVTAAPSVAAGWWTIGPAGKVGVAAGRRRRAVGSRPKVDIRRLFFLLGYARDQRMWRDETSTLHEARRPAQRHRRSVRPTGRRATEQGLLQGYRHGRRRAAGAARPAPEHDQLRRRYGLAAAARGALRRLRRRHRREPAARAAPPTSLLDGPGHRAGRRGTAAAPAPVASPTSRRSPRGRRLPTGSRPGSTRATTSPCAWPSSSCAVASVDQSAGTVVVSGFVLDMAKVFEDFVTARSRSALTAARRHCRAAGPLAPRRSRATSR